MIEGPLAVSLAVLKLSLRLHLARLEPAFERAVVGVILLSEFAVIIPHFPHAHFDAVAVVAFRPFCTVIVVIDPMTLLHTLFLHANGHQSAVFPIGFGRVLRRQTACQHHAQP